MEGEHAQVVTLRGGAARRPHGARARPLARRARQGARTRPSSRGSTSTTRTSPTGRRRRSATSSPRTPTTARSPSPTRSSPPSSTRLRPLGLARPHAGRGDRPTTARAWASTARRRTRCSCTRAPSACRSCFWRPGLAPGGRVVAEPVRSIDLAPTLLELARRARSRGAARAEPGAAPRGARRASAPLPAYSETLLPKFYMNWAPLRALRDGRYKLIDAPRPELYDLATDPARVPQPVRRARRRPPRRCARALERLAAGGRGRDERRDARPRGAWRSWPRSATSGPDAEAPAATESASLADPKDLIAVFNRLRQRQQRRPRAPLRRGASDPEGGAARGSATTPSRTLVLGSAYMGMAGSREAIAQFRRYLELVPTSSYAHQWMAICHLRLGERDGGAARGRGRPRARPEVHRRARAEGGRARRAGRARRGHRASCARPSPPTRRSRWSGSISRRSWREAGPSRRGARPSTRRCCGSSPTPCPALTGLGALQASQGDLDGASRRAAPGPGARAAAARGPLQPGGGPGAAGAAPPRPRRSTGSSPKSPKAPPALRAAARGPPATLEAGSHQQEEGRRADARRPLASVRRPVGATGRSSSELEAHAELGLPLAVRARSASAVPKLGEV